MTCKHCEREYKVRVGRGLCRSCWNKPEVRKKYHEVASFGGAGAANVRYTKEREKENAEEEEVGK